MKKYIAELLGTFALVFCGTGALIVDQQTSGAVSHVGVAITFGLIVMAMIYAFGSISGAHMNPAVTMPLPWREGSRCSRSYPISQPSFLELYWQAASLNFCFQPTKA